MNIDSLRLDHESMIFEFLDESSEFYLVDRILNFKWMLIQARKKDFYFTSDNPVIFYNSYYEKQKLKGNDFIVDRREKVLSKIKSDKRAGGGLLLTSDNPERRPGVKGVEIYFPISPQLCILLVDWQKGFKRLKFDQINEQIILQANQFIYSHQNHFTMVNSVLKQHPEIKDKKGKRTIIHKLIKARERKGDYKFKAISYKDLLEK